MPKFMFKFKQNENVPRASVGPHVPTLFEKSCLKKWIQLLENMQHQFFQQRMQL